MDQNRGVQKTQAATDRGLGHSESLDLTGSNTYLGMLRSTPGIEVNRGQRGQNCWQCMMLNKCADYSGPITATQHAP